MSISNCLTAALSASLVFGVGLPSAHAANPQSCVFDKYAPVAVAPYRSENGIDYGSYSYLGGAQLFVPAREGLTKEWLQTIVQRALSASGAQNASTSPACDAPDLKNVRVTVVSGGNGYWVQLVSPDSRAQAALLQWARETVDRHKR